MTLSDEAQAWLEATRSAAEEFSETSLGVGLGDLQATRALPGNLTGCFVALVGQEESLQIGLATDSFGCQTLAQTLFAAEEELSEADVTDALGEIANIMAGGVKKRRSESHGGMLLGLPIIMEGHVRVTDHQQMVTLDIAMGEVPVRLLVVCNREST